MIGELRNKLRKEIKDALSWEACKIYNAKLREIAELTEKLEEKS